MNTPNIDWNPPKSTKNLLAIADATISTILKIVFFIVTKTNAAMNATNMITVEAPSGKLGTILKFESVIKTPAKSSQIQSNFPFVK